MGNQDYFNSGKQVKTLLTIEQIEAINQELEYWRGGMQFGPFITQEGNHIINSYDNKRKVVPGIYLSRTSLEKLGLVSTGRLTLIEAIEKVDREK